MLELELPLRSYPSISSPPPTQSQSRPQRTFHLSSLNLFRNLHLTAPRTLGLTPSHRTPSIMPKAAAGKRGKVEKKRGKKGKFSFYLPQVATCRDSLYFGIAPSVSGRLLSKCSTKSRRVATLAATLLAPNPLANFPRPQRPQAWSLGLHVLRQ